MAGEFAKLVAEEGPEIYTELVNKFTIIIEASFMQDVVIRPVRTEAEVKRRFEIAARWFRTLRGDLKFSRQRIYDELPKALRCELEGLEYTPPTNDRAWVAPA